MRLPFQFKSVKDGVYTAVASSDALDRDKEVLIPLGAVLDNFMKNPVMLYIHNYRAVAVGKVLEVRPSEKEIEFDFVFAETDSGKEMKYLYDNGFMRAFSVGLYPFKWMDLESDSELKEVTFQLPNGKEGKLDLTKYKERPSRVVYQWELLEISPVPVPSNPEALLRRELNLAVERKFADGTFAKSFALDGIDPVLDQLMKSIESFADGIEACGAVPFASYPVNMEMGWDQATARAAIARWASSDNSGEKDKISWPKYAKGFGWFDESKSDAFTSYKLPHHVPGENGLVTVWRGVAAAMGALLGARGGSDVGDDGQRVYSHLVGHYKDAGKEPPEYHREYTEAELKAISETGELPRPEGGTPETSEPEPKEFEGLETVVSNVLKEMLLPEVNEINETVKVRLGVSLSIIEELVSSIQSSLGKLAAVEQPEESPGAPDVQQEEFQKAMDLLAKCLGPQN